MLSTDDLRNLLRATEFAEQKPIAERMTKALKAAEVGKKHTIIFRSSGQTFPAGDAGTQLNNIPEESVAKKKGSTVPVRFRIYVFVPKGKEEMLKTCRVGRRVFVSGEVREIDILSGNSMVRTPTGMGNGPRVVTVTIKITADDMGLNK